MTTLTECINTLASKKNYKEIENEKTRGKRRYLERINEEKEAEKLIRDYEEEQEQGLDDRETTIQKQLW
jgi:hypothetical protein